MRHVFNELLFLMLVNVKWIRVTSPRLPSGLHWWGLGLVNNAYITQVGDSDGFDWETMM